MVKSATPPNVQNFDKSNFPLQGPTVQQQLPKVPRSYLTMRDEPGADSPYRDPAKAEQHFKSLFGQLQKNQPLTSSHVQRVLSLVYFGGLTKALTDKLDITNRVIRIISASSPVNNRFINAESTSQLRHQIKTLQAEVKHLHDENLSLRNTLAEMSKADPPATDESEPFETKATPKQSQRANSNKKSNESDKGD